MYKIKGPEKVNKTVSKKALLDNDLMMVTLFYLFT